MFQIPSIKYLFFPIFCTAIFVSGCGGSSSSSPDPSGETADPGIGSLKAGAFEVTTPGVTGGQPSVMLLNPTGDCVIAGGGGGSNSLISCKLEVTDDAISGSLTFYNLVSGQWELEEGVISGTVTTSETANLVIKTDSDMSATVKIDRLNDESDRGISLAVLSGTYFMAQADNPSGDFDMSFTIDANGALTGSDSTGCAFNGEITIPDPKLSIFEMEYTAGNCGDSNSVGGEDRNGQFASFGIYGASTGYIEIVGANGKVPSFFGGQ